MSSNPVMNIYSLNAKTPGHRNRYYDISTMFVVVAPNENEARKICQVNGGDETKTYDHDRMIEEAYSFWTNSELTDCSFLGIAYDQNSDSRVICNSYNAG